MSIGFPDRDLVPKFDPKLPFLGKNREIGKNREKKPLRLQTKHPLETSKYFQSALFCVHENGFMFSALEPTIQNELEAATK